MKDISKQTIQKYYKSQDKFKYLYLPQTKQSRQKIEDSIVILKFIDIRALFTSYRKHALKGHDCWCVC